MTGCSACPGSGIASCEGGKWPGAGAVQVRLHRGYGPLRRSDAVL